ncbi:FAD-dependent oxidoreductase [Demequina muriae]|uniref:FAD-dependent monooxygenase n=1 Tax=Demequina muriae TaxID=3051664 RepID=A0ABT8GDZ2_9MICO|nr:FAD-dependent oxidoreductase [Demequina sp. EGI L300058]MDN4479651.1 FAD-dependent monooxygenase [Demequina sp. EGI L300058]
MTSIEGDVIVVGAGPVGMATALGLAHHGVRCTLVERRAEPTVGSKAFGVWGRTLETLDAWGLSERFLAAGDARDAVSPVTVETGRPAFTVDFTALAAESAMPGLLLIPQSSTERLLREAVTSASGIDLVDGDVTDVRLDDAGADVDIASPDGGVTTIRAAYVVGADGSRSAVRESQGVRHEGRIIDHDLLVFDIALEDDADLSPVRLVAKQPGLLAGLRFGPGRWRVLASLEALTNPTTTATDGPPPRKPDLPVERLEGFAHQLFGERELDVLWQSQTTLYQQRVPDFRLGGRILLAGDSAHLVSPAGGQGMNQGIQDAENLAWSLAAALRAGDGPTAESMLDGYAGEREHAADVVARRAQINSLLEFATPPWLRPLGFFALRIATRLSWFTRMLTRRLSMRDLRYRPHHSVRLRGSSRIGLGPVGRRLANVVLPDGTRMVTHTQGRAAVISIACDPPAVPPGMIAVRLESAPRGSHLRSGQVAVLRADRYVAAVLRRPSAQRLAEVLADTVGA